MILQTNKDLEGGMSFDEMSFAQETAGALGFLKLYDSFKVGHLWSCVSRSFCHLCFDEE
jgi:hypothetical protein